MQKRSLYVTATLSMDKNKSWRSFPAILLLLLLFVACTNRTKEPPREVIVETPEELDRKVPDILKETIDYALENNGTMADSVALFNAALSRIIYEENKFVPVWSSQEQWKPIADSLFQFIAQCRNFGLFPDDYHYSGLNTIRLRFLHDTLARSYRRDAVLWAKADLMLTDAFVHIVKDIKLGRLPNDSVTLRKDSVLHEEFYIKQLQALVNGESFSKLVSSLEPAHEGYHLLKAGIRSFLDSADYNTYTIVPSPRTKDTALFMEALQKRLFEGGYIATDSVTVDSLHLAQAIRKFQKQNNITVDGKAGETTVRILNTTDKERFVRIAISLDRFKLLPEKMPDRYIWVNLPAFSMKLQHGDSTKLVSKIICGKPATRTPLLTSSISEIITYPQWTVPASIIQKEILPAIKRDPGYLALKGFSLIDKNGEEVDPYSVDWSKYKKGIPYKVVQGSGDANALGVLKFNFPNKYAVYLHDTNQRHLFGRAVRTLSHGCVRVQEWQKLAHYILREEKQAITSESIPLIDSMDTWLSKKEKRSIPVRKRLPVYIRYFTCEGKPDGIAFYDDIYGEDKKLMEAYFTSW